MIDSTYLYYVKSAALIFISFYLLMKTIDDSEIAL